jgi:hypothetical protein
MAYKYSYIPNKKQMQFNELLATGDYAFGLYGGAIRGGKTFNVLHFCLAFALSYARSRWYICRQTFEALNNTCIPLARNLAIFQDNAKENMSQHEWTFKNKSVIKFYAPNIQAKGGSTLGINGIEPNGIFLDEMDISFIEFNALAARVGAWQNAEHGYNPVTGIYGPPPAIFAGTSNPQNGFVKQMIYDPWKNGTLEKKYFYIPATIEDNTSLEKGYVEGLKQRLTKREYNEKVLGDWDFVSKVDDALFYSFNPEFHIFDEIAIDNHLPIIASFDNNVHPYIAVSIWQIDEEKKELRQIDELPCKNPKNTATRAGETLADWLKAIDWKGHVVMCGDASTNSANTINEEKKTFADLIIKPVKEAGFYTLNRVLKNNPNVASTSDFCNALYENWGGWTVKISKKCNESIIDYSSVRIAQDGTMLKEKAKNASGISYEKFGHFSDTKRYLIYSQIKDEYNSWRNRFNGDNFLSKDELNIFTNFEQNSY